MFDPATPRLFGIPPGLDFSETLVSGLEQRLISAPPQDWARVHLIVNTHRMKRRLREVFDTGPERLLPRVSVVTDLANDLSLPELPPAASGLGRRLELMRLVDRLTRQEPELAPRSALFDLSDLLAGLLDELQGEGVSPRALHDLDVSHLAAHWQRTRRFVEIAEAYLAATGTDALDPEARQRQAVQALIARWTDAPPDNPVILAGSTGSRGTTALLMQAVARLPQGAVVLPGFDFDQPATVWQALNRPSSGEDHPQYRFAYLARALDIPPTDIHPWTGKTGPDPARNALISLALRPAPVTDQWLRDGPGLPDLPTATRNMTLIEAPSPRAEALSIALCLRNAAEEGKTVALVSPDRNLTRQVTAALDRWGILPDDSAGTPLHLTAPGRFLRLIAEQVGQRLTPVSLLSLLTHPLTATGSDRGQHLLWTRELELELRRNGPVFPAGPDLIGWAESRKDADHRVVWANWLAGLIDGLSDAEERPLCAHVDTHMALAEALSAGPDGNIGDLWKEEAGAEARAAFDQLAAEATDDFSLSNFDYSSLIYGYLSGKEVRLPAQTHPRIMIWGTLEARVQSADLIVLGGLNEGSWPAQPAPDPWLSRDMRQRLGLLLPERRIGLSAHDFQQAVCGPAVVLTRATRDAEAETVPARWINRLTNLLAGLPDQGGDRALEQMRARGDAWVALARVLETPLAPVAPSPRPSPNPPAHIRPERLSVTRIQTLIRDPYAIYAGYILRLRPLDPLLPQPDAPLRGTILHAVMERFVASDIDPADPMAVQGLLSIADAVLSAEAPWPAARQMWRARLTRVARAFVADEIRRQSEGNWVALERKGSVTLQNGFQLSAEADRIDRLNAGGLVIYDYKTGTPPSEKTVKAFDKQLLLEAAMAERGGFDDLPPEPVSRVAYIGLGAKPGVSEIPLEPGLIAKTWADLETLIDRYRNPQQGYAARRMLFSRRDETDYDQLSRFGEWDESMPPQVMRVGDET
ncbi:double-strand break repair protein AddB [Actibacterium ureilyticum]|uniref:double-strand break repair protein AddB n=1 Tax=Actibacterium ureilyticum TaxID=1590614 RepID=UPI000BAABB81|nr:double-strand break repair protein AddB [Actibacterium ureilyticum]